MTAIRLALGGAERTWSAGLAERRGWRTEDKPSMLISYHYRQFIEWMQRIDYRDWVLDSGAFSAAFAGAHIDLDEYIEFCKTHPGISAPSEIFGLDVIGDWEAGLRNVEKMWSEGVEAIPTYHIGEPKEVLEHIVARYPKIAISVSGTRLRGAKLIEWCDQVFAIAWPKKIHGFALVRQDLLRRFPFHSVDSTTWLFGPQAFGNWRSKLGRSMDAKRQVNLSVWGTDKDLRDEVDYFLRMERKLRALWRNELAMLELEEAR